jgi:hypothetical protein
MSPAIMVVTTTVIVAFAPFAMLPRLHVKTPPKTAPQVPWLGVAESRVTLAGNVSVTVTPVAEFGPRLVTVIVYVICSPTKTGSGESVLVIARSAGVVAGLTVVVIGPAVLLPELGSGVVLNTLALLLRSGGLTIVGVTVMVIVALAPLARLPRLQVTVLVPLQLPWLGMAEPNVTLPGNVSVTVTAEAEVGPLLVTMME